MYRLEIYFWVMKIDELNLFGKSIIILKFSLQKGFVNSLVMKEYHFFKWSNFIKQKKRT